MIFSSFAPLLVGIPAVLPFLGYVAFASLCTGLPPLLAPFVVLCLLVLGGTVAGYAHAFAYFQIVNILLGLALGLVALLRLLHGPTRRLPHAFPALMVLGFFALLSLYFSWYFIGTQFSYYDEFFWGAFAKAFRHENGFWTALSSLARDDMSQAYPPMPAVLANIFISAGGAYSEEGIALGGMLLVLAAAAVVYHYMHPHVGRTQALLLAFVAACLMRVMGTKCTTYYLTGYTDYLQGALFTGLLSVAVFETRLRRALLPLLTGLAVLAMCKQTGIVLCLAVMGVAGAGWLWRQEQPRPPLYAWLAMLAAMLVASFAPWIAWGLYVKEHIPQPVGGALLNFKAALLDPLLWPSFKEYLWAAFERPLIISPGLGWLSYGTGTLALTLTACLLLYFALGKAQRSNGAAVIQALLLLAGLLGWYLLHWYASLVYFTEEQILWGASYERYVGPYMAGAWLTWLMLSLRAWQESSQGRLAGRVIVTVLALAMPIVCTIIPWERPAPYSRGGVRAHMEVAAQLIRENTPPGSLFHFIPEQGNMEEEWCLRYLLAPERKGTSLLPQGINVPGQARVVQARFVTPPVQQWFNMLRGQRVDYVLMFAPGTLKEHVEYFSEAQVAPLLVYTPSFSYDARNNTLEVSSNVHPGGGHE